MLHGCIVWFPAFRIPYFSALLGGSTVRQSSLLPRKPRGGGKILCSFSFHFMPLYRVMTLYFVKFNVKISIIIDYLRNSYYLCNLIYHFQALHLPSPIESWQKTNTYKHLHNPSRSLISDNRLNPKNWRNSVLSCQYF